MRLLNVLLFCFCLMNAITAQKTDAKLQQQINELVKGFHGDVGIYVLDVKHNTAASINPDTLFATASIVKLSILIGIMDKIEKGELDYHQHLLYTDSLFYNEGDDILSKFKDSSLIELGKVMMLMLSISDNCASLWLQGLAGGGTVINALLYSLGYTYTRVNSRTPGREASRAQYGWGQTTPREIVSMLKNIADGKTISKTASEKMLRLLGRQYWDDDAISQIPAGVFVADKSGALDENRNEVLYVNGKENPYFFSIFTKNNADTSWQYNNEAWVLTRKLSALLWHYYNPKEPVSDEPLKKELP